jgi:uncharacterized protein
MDTTPYPMEKLCLQCGICCNGVLFRDVELPGGPGAETLRNQGLRLLSGRGKLRLPQPCAALNGFHCRVYTDRPAHCHDFECGLYKAVLDGRVIPAFAIRTIRKTLRLGERVRQLLQQLGSDEESLALSLRFQRVKKRLNIEMTDDDTAATFADLSLAVHELNLLLRGAFYPGDDLHPGE